jgi:hypothetical protein
MKRDMDLIRKVLLAVEEHGSPFNVRALKIDGYEKFDVSYHVGILREGGYLEAKDMTTHDSGGKLWAPTVLTWKGHDFVDATRSDTIWQKAKDRIAKIGGDVSIDVIKGMAVQIAKELLGLKD